MAEHHLPDIGHERSQEEMASQGTEHLAELSSYPGLQEELLPLSPWYRRWINRVWHLFPCTIVNVTIAGILGSAFQFGGDFISGLERGVLFGALLGCILDARISMNGEMIDE